MLRDVMKVLGDECLLLVHLSSTEIATERGSRKQLGNVDRCL